MPRRPPVVVAGELANEAGFAVLRVDHHARDGEAVAILTPEKRVYQVRAMPTTEAAIRTTFFSDLYALLGDSDGAGGWTVRVYHEPLVPWIWIGCLVMVVGGLTSLSDRRLRVGAPARQTKATTRPAAA